LTGLDPAAVYYWRVRATKPYLSPWSEASSFTTIIGGSNITSILIVPAAGATTAVKPVFQWSPVISADSYDLQVANNIDFKNPVIDKTGDNALPGNAWESEIALENGLTYFGRVKARSDISFGAWSPIGVFVTEKVPVTTESAAAPVLTTVITTTAPAQPVQVVSTTVTLQMTNNPQPVNVTVSVPQRVIVVGVTMLGVIIVILVGLLIITVRRR
jgi:hypothetical protein